MGKINILYYEASSGFGGSANVLVNIIKFLDRNRFHPIVLIKELGPQIEKIKDAEILKLRRCAEPKKTSKFKFLLHFINKIIPEAIRILFILKKKNIALVHINTDTITGLAPLIAAKLAGSRCVTHVRGTMELLKRQIIFSKWIDKFLIVNKKAYEICAKHLPEGNLCLIYDGIDLQDFDRVVYGCLKKEYNLDSYPLVGIVGRIVEGKGHKEFILVAKEVLKVNKNVKFLIIGEAVGAEDNCYKEIKSMVTQYQLEQNIIFTGWRNDINNVIADLDVLVQATTTFPEGFGLTIIEAMALSKPVIATNIPGPSEIVIDGGTGFLVKPRDINTMAEKIIYLLENKELANKMGKEGRNRVEVFFKIENTVKKIEEIYIEITSSKI